MEKDKISKLTKIMEKMTNQQIHFSNNSIDTQK